jgi:predicted nucleic acid-binding protein
VIVLSDSSPLISLSKIGLVELLPQLYDKVTITPEVYAEVVVSGGGRPGASEIAKATWIEVKPAKRTGEISQAKDRFPLGVGELSTILLALELGADLILIDDLTARKHARENGFICLGCVGILEYAFHLNLISDLPHAYKQLLASGAYVARSVCEASLQGLHLPRLDAD